MKSNQPEGPLALIILDGWGVRRDKTNNGIELAQKPFFDSLCQNFPNTCIDGSGPAVGLPDGIMGNSEVGHMNIGAGRIVYSGLSQIYSAIENGDFFKNPAFMQAIQHIKKNQGRLHLLGLLSDGAVHSHQDHLYALMQLAKDNDLQDVLIHCFMDGRDVPPRDGLKYLAQLEKQIAKIGVGQIASICGRYYAMDRDDRWDRIQLAYQAMCGHSDIQTDDYRAVIQKAYRDKSGDEFIMPMSLTQNGQPVSSVDNKDAMIFFNFRADRAREITRSFVAKDFSGFERDDHQMPGLFICTSPYDTTLNAPIAFQPSYPEKILPEVIAEAGLKQMRLAETEKYAHVTFFFNGGRDVQYKNETRLLVPSPKVTTYDLQPEMSAYEVKDKFISALKTGQQDVIICNFANTDMVGHTAIPEAIFKAVAVVDECLAQIIPQILALNGTALIISDHGNAEVMVDENGEPMTAHTTNLVPFILVSNKYKTAHLKSGGRLCDVAPTMLKILNIQSPVEMTGQSLIT